MKSVHTVENPLTGGSAGSFGISEGNIARREKKKKNKKKQKKKNTEYTPNCNYRKENFPAKSSNLTTY